jgi:hypothetical protein
MLNWVTVTCSTLLGSGCHLANIRILEVEMTTSQGRHEIPWYLWPFAAIWKLLAVIVEMTGRLLAMVLGILLIVVGVIVSLTIVGAIIGIPLAIVGFLLFLRGIF